MIKSLPIEKLLSGIEAITNNDIDNIGRSFLECMIDYKMNRSTCPPAHILERIERICNLYKCVVCNSKDTKYKLHCNHYFCESCLSNSIKSLSKFPEFYECPSCSRPHHKSEMEKICEDLWGRSDVKITSNSMQQLECFECKRPKNKKLLVSNLCPSHKYCKECLAKKYRTGDYKCSECDHIFDHDPNDLKGYCSSCTETVYYVGDYLTTLCKDHTHCYKCLEKALEEKICETCFLELEENDLMIILDVLFGTCHFCKNECKRIFTVNKQCCDKIICGVCQAENPYKCLHCGTDLSAQAMQFIQQVLYEAKKYL